MKNTKYRGTYAKFFLRSALYCFLAFFFSKFKSTHPPHKGSDVFLNIGLTQTCIATAVPPPLHTLMGTLPKFQEGDKQCKIIVRNKVFESQGGGGGGGYSHFFFIRRLTPSIYRLPQNKYQEFQAPPNITSILYLDLKKRP